MPKKCSKEAFEQKLLARLSKQTPSVPLNIMKLCVKTYAGNRPRDWCNNNALKEKRSLANKLVKTDENPVLLEYTLNKYIKKQYGGRITLREAYAQGGVLKHQVLLLKHSDYSTIPGFFYGTIQTGLYIYDSFKIESGGKVIIEDPLENRQDFIGVAGLAVKGPNAQLINDGEIIVNKSIKSNANVFGILCENSTCINLGTIHFKSDIIAIYNSYGITSANYATINNNGTILFDGKIVSNVNNAWSLGIYSSDNSTINNLKNIYFKRAIEGLVCYGIRVGRTIEPESAARMINSGTINFESHIKGSDWVTGIRGLQTGTNESRNDIINSGTISFKGILESEGIQSHGILAASLINNGHINFNDKITCREEAYGLRTAYYNNSVGNIENNGHINFNGEIASREKNAYGVFGDKRASLENNGQINFNGKIAGQVTAYGVYGRDSGNIENNGTINFNGEIGSLGAGAAYGIYGRDSANIENNDTISFQMIHSPRYNARGTYAKDAATVNNNGTINFNDDIIGGAESAVGIIVLNELNNSGIINFEQNLICPNGYVTGIEVYNPGSLTNNNGANINFNGDIQAGSGNGGIYPTGIWIQGPQNAMTLDTNSLISFNSDVTFYPTENLTNVITGNGQILYNNDQQYYPNTQIDISFD